LANSYNILFLNISNPASPIVFDSLYHDPEFRLSLIDMEISEDNLYFSHYADSRYEPSDNLFVYDISNTANPQEIVSYYDHVYGITSIDINEEVACLNSPHNGVLLYDLSQPSVPSFISKISTASKAIALNYPNLYLITYGHLGDIYIYDISVPEQPEFFNSINPGTSPTDIYLDDNLAFVTGSQVVEIFSVENPANPISVGQIDFINAQHMLKWNEFLFLVKHNVFKIYDISDLYEPTEIAEIVGCYPEGIAIIDSTLFAICYLRGHVGLRVFDISDITNPEETNSIRLISNEDASQGNYAILPIENEFGEFLAVSVRNRKFKIVNVTDPEDPYISGYYFAPFSPNEFAYSNGYLYSAENASLGIYNLDDALPAMETISIAPLDFKLNQAYPNPFNASTRIGYTLPEKGFVLLNIYDILGRKVTTLINRQQPQGYHTIHFDGNNLSSGTYFYELKSGTNSQAKQMMLLK